MLPLLALPLRHDEDVLAASRCAAYVTAILHFDATEQTRLAAAVSEIAGNAFRYAVGGAVSFELDVDARPQQLSVRAEDRGPGIPHLPDVLVGRFQSTALGIGIAGARRLLDRFAIDSSLDGTRVVLAKSLPPGTAIVTPERAQEMATALQRFACGLQDDVQQRTQTMVRTVDELHRNQQELTRLNRELDDSNRSVVALCAELDDKSDDLRRVDDLKSRFLANITHEFRTPVNAIIGLCNLLRDDKRREGHEPEPELDFILKAAGQLSTLVNDLLDLAKAEAGKTVLRPATFEVQNLFGALLGMLGPLLPNRDVALSFDDAADLPPIHTDEARVTQILRNLISNSLKFTERGEVRVSASVDEAAGVVTFRVADTGIGIATDDQAIIFEEFEQIEHRLQRSGRGTGLGLPLSRRLAQLLGGSLDVASEPGVGSVFSVMLPVAFVSPEDAEVPFPWTPNPLLPVHPALGIVRRPVPDLTEN